MKTYGIIGYPLAHSCSPSYFNDWFKQEGIDAEFLPFEIENIQQLETILEEYPHLSGFNVTIPHKQNILPYLHEISEEAQKIGAVNCVKISRQNGKLWLSGYNTDMFGFRHSLLEFIPHNMPKKALILGNGGAAKAVHYALKSLGMEVLTVSRHPQKQDEITYAEVRKIIAEFRLIVNTTPLGTWPHTEDCPDIPYELLSAEHYLYDLVYNPEVTQFMEQGRTAGASTCNGHAMWLGQAKKNWKIWEIS